MIVKFTASSASSASIPADWFDQSSYKAVLVRENARCL
jgi:hypothetical protein